MTVPGGTGPPRRQLLLAGASGLLLVGVLSCLWWPRSPSPAGPELRVRLRSLGFPASLTVSAAGLTGPGAEALPSPFRLAAREGRLLGPDGEPLAEPFVLGAAGALRLDPPGASYPGRLAVSAGREGLLVDDLVAMEDYLPGVVAGELGDAWPAAALAAQAVAARTYALWTLERRRQAAFTLDDTAACQVFRGRVDPGRPVAAAAAATRGLVLELGGETCPAWYSSTCGGHTARAREIFPGAPDDPALAGVACPWCAGSRHHRWQAGPFPAERIRSLFGLPPAGELSGLEAAVREGASGRWLGARLLAPDGEATLPMARLRRELGLKSAWIQEVRFEAGGVLLAGAGWGHGVGLCQVGAAAMARAGRSWREILAFYYPGAAVEKAW